MLTIGPHLSIAKGYAKTMECAVKMGANTFQFFSRNPRGSNFRARDEGDIALFQKMRVDYGFGKLQAHAPYTMNLASESEKVQSFAREVIGEDVARMEALGIEYMCLHPGSHLGAGVDAGIRRIIEGLDQGITGTEKLMVLLETMPGKGTEIGSEFSHLRRIMDESAHKERLGVCMDLCHVFSAGYDIKNNLEKVLAEFDRIIGLSHLKSIHLNDSLTPFGEHKDRHTPVGLGQIGLTAATAIMKHPCLKELPFYLETPLDDEGHKEEIELLKNQLGL